MAAGGSLLTALCVGKQRAGDTSTQRAFFFLSLCSVPTPMHRMLPPPIQDSSPSSVGISLEISGGCALGLLGDSKSNQIDNQDLV